MAKVKIVSDSSSDILTLDKVDFASAPLKIITDGREFTDDAALDVEDMVSYLEEYNGRSSTSCPNTEDWIKTFGDADEVYCVTITSGLSGSYNSACTAKRICEERDPDRKICVIDSLSAGPEMALIIKKLESLVDEGREFNDVCKAINEYKKKTGLLFMLESMKNLANNGRVSKVTAKFAGLLNIRVVGRASDEGVLEPLDKPRGQRMTLQKIAERLESLGYRGGRIHISHCFAPAAAEELKKSILEKFAKANIVIGKCRGLCSFYAEKGGMLIGFESV